MLRLLRLTSRPMDVDSVLRETESFLNTPLGSALYNALPYALGISLAAVLAKAALDKLKPLLVPLVAASAVGAILFISQQGPIITLPDPATVGATVFLLAIIAIGVDGGFDDPDAYLKKKKE